MKLIYPKVCFDSRNRVFVSFYLENKRHRLYSGKQIGIDIKPNSYPLNQRKEIGRLLAAEIYKYLSKEDNLMSNQSGVRVSLNSDFDYLKLALNNKLKENFSNSYKQTLKQVFNDFTSKLNGSKYTKQDVIKFLGNYSNETSYNTIRRHLNVLFNEAYCLGLTSNPIQGVKSKRSKASLHKPFDDINSILDDIYQFDKNLHLCCLLTYGCLLRPHKEIRELKWGDFTDDLSFIRLCGKRNKSGRNRIVPVPDFVKKYLIKSAFNRNIFTNSPNAFNPYYFKTLWSRFKQQSISVEPNQTLYSFRHSGAINIFKRTGSIHKLQSALSHSSINVSLVYLRNLDIPELTNEDMPILE